LARKANAAVTPKPALNSPRLSGVKEPSSMQINYPAIEIACSPGQSAPCEIDIPANRENVTRELQIGARARTDGLHPLEIRYDASLDQ